MADVLRGQGVAVDPGLPRRLPHEVQFSDRLWDRLQEEQDPG